MATTIRPGVSKDAHLAPTAWQQSVAACVGAVLTSLVVTPLDVVKTRMQEQHPLTNVATASSRPSTARRAHIHPARLYWHRYVRSSAIAQELSSPQAIPLRNSSASLWSASSSIVKNEGLTALWRGLSPTIVMSIPGTVVYFVGYDRLRSRLSQTLFPAQVVYAPFIAGVMARTIAATIISPVELFRTQMQATAASGMTIQEVLAVVRSMVRQTGVSYLWRGLPPTLWRDVPFSGIYWFSYESLKQHYADILGHTIASNGVTVPFLAGATAGMIAATVTTPFDVAKTRRQIGSVISQTPMSNTQHYFNPPPLAITGSYTIPGQESIISRSTSLVSTSSSNGVWAILRNIFQTDGWAGLFRGLAPRVIKVAPSCAIMVSSYEYGKVFYEQGLLTD